jgi:hypothetical protein
LAVRIQEEFHPSKRFFHFFEFFFERAGQQLVAAANVPFPDLRIFR